MPKNRPNRQFHKEDSITSQKQPSVAANEAIGVEKIFLSYLSKFKAQAILVSLIAFLFYFNTFSNENALDDTMVIVQNKFVLQGFAGIPDILANDGYDGYYTLVFKNTDPMAGGRYRPLSLVSFAVEQEFMGAVPENKLDSVMENPPEQSPQKIKLVNNMHTRHVFNVLWYMLCVVALLYFLRYVVFKNDPLAALVATIIFAIHPIHTEVVANVKSRDEIMSLLFTCLTFIFAFKYQEHKKKWLLGIALLCYLLAFLSKEYAITLVVLLPLSFYIFNKSTLKHSIMATLPYLGVALIYFLIRLKITGNAGDGYISNLYSEPYLLASGVETFATKIATSLNYLKLLIYPYPLSADYSYNSIPYKDFSHPLVWLSLIVHGSLIVLFFYFLRRRNVMAFAIGFYLLNLALVSNIFFEIGATMGERLIFQSSVGFAIAVAYLLVRGVEFIKTQQARNATLSGFMIVLILMCGYETMARNRDWKNNSTLYRHDVETAPNSYIVNNWVANDLVAKSKIEKDTAKQNELRREAIKYFQKSVSIYPGFSDAQNNLACAFFRNSVYDSAKGHFQLAVALNPKNTDALNNMTVLAGIFYDRKNYESAAELYKSVSKYSPKNAEATTDAGICYELIGKNDSAIYYLNKSISINPDSKKTYQNLALIYRSLGNSDSANKYEAKAR